MIFEDRMETPGYYRSYFVAKFLKKSLWQIAFNLRKQIFFKSIKSTMSNFHFYFMNLWFGRHVQSDKVVEIIINIAAAACCCCETFMVIYSWKLHGFRSNYNNFYRFLSAWKLLSQFFNSFFFQFRNLQNGCLSYFVFCFSLVCWRSEDLCFRCCNSKSCCLQLLLRGSAFEKRFCDEIKRGLLIDVMSPFPLILLTYFSQIE